MHISEIFGYVGALFIGLTLGLSGAGGSILTVPILVYLMGFDSVLSTAYSLFIVGSTAAVGAARNLIKGFTRVNIAVWFGLPSMISIFITRKYIITNIPDELISISGFVLTKQVAVLLLFATLMVFSASRMIRSRKKGSDQELPHGEVNHSRLILQGLMVGFLTGLVGAGGGFLIVPALVIMAKLPMKNAIGTSLLIIATNSMIGFLGDLTHREIEWEFLLPFASLAMVGIFVGMRLADRVNGAQLKKGFGYFVLVIAALIIFRELSSLLGS